MTKSFTDIEQSKKLAEILPLESADMYYYKDYVHAIMSAYHPNIVIPSFGVRNMPNYGEGDIPCWSLSALLNVINNTYYVTLLHDGVMWNILVIHHDIDKCNHTIHADNPVDACCEMIIRLY